jgi:transcriptional regulator with XRE-family HTH domain
MTTPETPEDARVLSLPTIPARLQSPPPGDIVVGSYLRALRRDTNRTALQIAKALHINLATVSQMERAASPLAPSRVRDMLRLYGLRARTEIALVERLLADPQDPYRFRVVDDGRGAHDRLAATERSATVLRSYTLHLLPRPYRTRGYNEALVRSGRQKDVEVRPAPLGQAAPRPGHGPQFSLVLDESVLRRAVGGPTVMAIQLEYLLELIEDGRARVHVVPATSGIPPLEPSITELVVHGHRLYVAEQPFGIEYRAGDGYPAILHEWLNELVRVSDLGESSYDRIKRARDDLWARARNQPAAR